MVELTSNAPSSERSYAGLVRPVLISSLLFMLVTGLAYPLATTGAANLRSRDP